MKKLAEEKAVLVANMEDMILRLERELAEL